MPVSHLLTRLPHLFYPLPTLSLSFTSPPTSPRTSSPSRSPRRKTDRSPRDTDPGSDINALASLLRAAERDAARLRVQATDAERARRLAEEQRDVALQRLAAQPAESACLLREVRAAAGREDKLRTCLEREREAVRRERERVTMELAQRTNNFLDVERELRDARETYVTAAAQFQQQREALAERLNRGEEERRRLEKAVGAAEERLREKQGKLSRCEERCEELVRENERLRKRGGQVEMRKGACGKEDLENVIAERDQLRLKVSRLSGGDGSEVSSSSVSSSSSSSPVVTQRVVELEASLESEAREVEMLRRKVSTLSVFAKTKETEAKRLRGEMTAIHSRMRRMVTVSMPKGVEEVGEEDDHDEEEDRKKLAGIREKAREEEKKASLDYARRGGRRKLADTQNVTRPWLNR